MAGKADDATDDKTGKGAGDDKSGDKGKGKDDKTPPALTAKDIGDVVAGSLARTMGPLLEGFNKLSETLAAAQQSRGKGKAAAGEEEAEPDWDRMTNGEMAKKLISSIRDDLQSFGEQVKERLEQGASGVEETRAAQEVSRLTQRYPDFMEWREEMKAQIRSNEALTIEQAYKLAKADNPEKVATLAKKAKDVNDTSDEDNAGEDTPRGRVRGKQQFGGLLPTSGKQRANNRMKAIDAAGAAWKETGMDNYNVGD